MGALVLSVHVPDTALRLSEARMPLEHIAILVASLLGAADREHPQRLDRLVRHQ